MTAFAIYTVLYDIALLLSWSLAMTFAVWAAVLLFVLVILSWFSLKRELHSFFRAVPRGKADLGLRQMTGLGIVTALVSLLVSKFNEDDSFYMSRAVLDWENWWRPIATGYPFAFTKGAGGIFTSLPSFEHFLAGIAAVSGTHPLDLYYFAAPALVGFLMPFGWYLCLLRAGLSRRGAVFGTSFIVILMLLDGATARSIANFSLFRLWQGKDVLISAVTPVAIAAALDAVNDGGTRQWVKLLLIGIVGIGLSTTAAFFLPVLVAAAGFAWRLTKPAMTTIWRAPAAALAFSFIRQFAFCRFTARCPKPL